MNTRSIKFRLIAWYAGWLTVVFSVFGVVVYKSLDHYLVKALRQALEMRTRHVAALVQRSPLDWDGLGQEIHYRFAPEANNRFTRVTADREVKYLAGAPSDGSFDPAVVPPASQRVEDAFERRILPGGVELLVAVKPVIVNNRTVLVEEGFSKAGINDTVRAWLVALAWNHPRSSFFANEETFIAEKQLTKDESRLVKLIYNFLPYQPRLSDYGLDYYTVHELRAVRDPQSDEKLAQIMIGQIGDWRQQQSQLKYASEAPVLNAARSTRPLPCYVTDADDYDRSLPEAEENPAR